jgi:molybdopterin/thiamine biosynthesis adenylyltransferase
MIAFLVIAAGLWTLGAVMKAPRHARWLMIAILYVGVLMIEVGLPEGAALRELFGGSPEPWIILGVLTFLVLLYREALRRVRLRVRPVEVPARPEGGVLSEAEVERYARHVVLREIGGPGQRRLKETRVLVLGAGGLGSSALLYLAAAGIGRIGVVDHDVVDASNLQRQVIHRDVDQDAPKALSAARAMTALNPHVEVRPYVRRFEEGIAEELMGDYDLVLDGTDDWRTRALANQTAVALGVPLVSGAIAQWEGQVSLFDPARGTPCHACVFPKEPEPGVALSCSEGGVLGPLPGIVGSLMAAEAVKWATGAGETLAGRLMILDALGAEARVIRIAPRPGCPVCGGRGARQPDGTALAAP